MITKLKQFEAKEVAKQKEVKKIPDFKAGDTIKVHVKIIEGATERVQIFEGVCIKYRNSGAGSTFAVKKISNGEMVERTFMLYSPKVAKIEVMKRGRVRRAKLYYMRERTGKAARIKELNKFGNNNNAAAEKSVKAEAKVEAPQAEAEKPAE